MDDVELWKGEVQMHGGRSPGQTRKARILKREGSCLDDIPAPRGEGLRLETLEPRSGDWRRTFPGEIDATSLVMALVSTAASASPHEATEEARGGA
jgi:hypothetical protein